MLRRVNQTLGKRNHQLMLVITFLHYSLTPHLFIPPCSLVLTFGRANRRRRSTTHLHNPSHLTSIAVSVTPPSSRSLVERRVDLKNTQSIPMCMLGIEITSRYTYGIRKHHAMPFQECPWRDIYPSLFRSISPPLAFLAIHRE